MSHWQRPPRTLACSPGPLWPLPRSPMVTASTAWELADVSGGRFRLGLGTQVRAHIPRRYSAEFDPTGPRLLDYALAVRASFAAFRGDPPDHHDPYYDLSWLAGHGVATRRTWPAGSPSRTPCAMSGGRRPTRQARRQVHH